MTEKLGLVKNPLTVIAIYAGLAEVSGTVVLPQLDPAIQGNYMWFPMLFPVLLVALFFITLLWKHHVLYAPTDFRSDDSFTGLLMKASDARRFAKLDQEAADVQTIDLAQSNARSDDAPQTPPLLRRELRATGLLAEELAIIAVGREFGMTLQRNVAFASNPRVILDGVAALRDRTIVVEVKYVRSEVLRPGRLDATVSRLVSVYESLPLDLRRRFELVVAVVTDDIAKGRHDDIAIAAASALAACPFKTSVRVFDLGALNQQVERDSPAEEHDRQEGLQKRILGLLGAGRPREFRDLLSILRIEPGDYAGTAAVQEALGALVSEGRIEHDPLSIESYRMKETI